MASHSGWLVDNRAPRGGGSVWQIFTLEQLKSHSWNIALETAHPSVGRSLSAGHHRLILPLCRLRQRTATRPPTPLQRHYASKGNRPIYRTVNRLELFIRFLTLLCSPVDRVQSRLARLASHIPSTPCKPSWVVGKLPRHEQNETPARPLPHYGKIRKTEFSNGDFV